MCRTCRGWSARCFAPSPTREFPSQGRASSTSAAAAATSSTGCKEYGAGEAHGIDLMEDRVAEGRRALPGAPASGGQRDRAAIRGRRVRPRHAVHVPLLDPRRRRPPGRRARDAARASGGWVLSFDMRGLRRPGSRPRDGQEPQPSHSTNTNSGASSASRTAAPRGPRLRARAADRAATICCDRARRAAAAPQPPARSLAASRLTVGERLGGTPPTTAPSGTDSRTTAPAATTARAPISQPASTVAFAPIQAPAPILAGSAARG